MLRFVQMVGKQEVEPPRPCDDVGPHETHHPRKDAQRALCVYGKRLAGDESAVASVPSPTSGRAPRGSPAAAACPSA
jgi:hypothetical protein